MGEPTAYGQLCLAIDAMVAKGLSEDDIIKDVKHYYSKLQLAALEKGVTMQVVTKVHPRVTENRVIALMQAELFTLANPGICIACGGYSNECEPDAENYECYACGKKMVFGAAELMLQGLYH